MKWFDQFADKVSTWSGSLPVVVAAFVGVFLWGLSGFVVGFTDTWQLIINTATTITTGLLVFIIQHTQNKNDRAVHAKLDDIIRAVDKTSDRLIGIEKKSEEELAALEEGNEDS